ncbi:hypothetical protein AKJ36_00125 [candidate division MSBL1 archaeon SCGC-AAA259I07]|uniref:Uncharacterized protein n=1 Tax=candidate division MSBL1 archaeon SCGC-AAA259I07 TaxID=1698266 RepID=A0A133UMX3_9EURY|nr:hypothetical protein AKJ36_00125 [candidate division MSBL1 archaeon SCGC-AAA259I07]
MPSSVQPISTLSKAVQFLIQPRDFLFGREMKAENDEIWGLVLGDESWAFQDRIEMVEKIEERAEGLSPRDILAFRIRMSDISIDPVDWREVILEVLDGREKKEFREKLGIKGEK